MADRVYGETVLRGLKTELLTMSSLAQVACSKACAAVQNHDAALAEEVVKGDDVIDEMELELDERCTSVIARIQPVARDLRFVLTTVRMVIDLERIADEAVTVARQVQYLPENLPEDIQKALDRFMQVASDMLDTAAGSFRSEDVNMGMAVFNYSDESVQLLLSVYRNLVMDVQLKQIDSGAAVPLILVVRSLDRMCRRSENIVEHLCFMCDGITVKHRARLTGSPERIAMKFDKDAPERLE